MGEEKIIARTYNRCIGRAVIISGHVGGTVTVRPDGSVYTRDYYYTNKFDAQDKRVFDIIPASFDTYGPDAVAFRVHGTESVYLTLNPYGNNARNEIARSLSHAPFLPEHLDIIIDFVVGNATNEDNFEGDGYNYEPMKAENSTQGTPGLLQVFHLEEKGGGSVGIRSMFRKYWRSQHWDHIVSQSPHCERDETWRFSLSSD